MTLNRSWGHIDYWGNLSYSHECQFWWSIKFLFDIPLCQYELKYFCGNVNRKACNLLAKKKCMKKMKLSYLAKTIHHILKKWVGCLERNYTWNKEAVNYYHSDWRFPFKKIITHGKDWHKLGRFTPSTKEAIWNKAITKWWLLNLSFPSCLGIYWEGLPCAGWIETGTFKKKIC